MGTSTLYGGPKKTSLLPSDYEPYEAMEENSELDSSDSNDSFEENSNPEEAKISDTDISHYNEEISDVSSEIMPRHDVAWSSVRRAMTKALKDRNSRNVRRVISNYTKALGGHSNASRQAANLRKTAGTIYSFFSDTPERNRKKLEEAGIALDNRSTKDILHDICGLIAPIPNTLDDSLVNRSLQETVADVIADSEVDLKQINAFNQELLQKLVSGLVKHYIFNKLIAQSEQSALKKCKNISELRNLETSIKGYIDGIVDAATPSLIKNGVSNIEFNHKMEILFEICYRQMEELK